MKEEQFKPKTFKENQEEFNNRKSKRLKAERMQDNITIACMIGVAVITLFTFLWMDRAYTNNAIKGCMQEHSQDYCEKVTK